MWSFAWFIWQSEPPRYLSGVPCHMLPFIYVINSTMMKPLEKILLQLSSFYFAKTFFSFAPSRISGMSVWKCVCVACALTQRFCSRLQVHFDPEQGRVVTMIQYVFDLLIRSNSLVCVVPETEDRYAIYGTGEVGEYDYTLTLTFYCESINRKQKQYLTFGCHGNSIHLHLLYRQNQIRVKAQHRMLATLTLISQSVIHNTNHWATPSLFASPVNLKR